jgi:hypothetical protein
MNRNPASIPHRCNVGLVWTETERADDDMSPKDIRARVVPLVRLSMVLYQLQ